MTLLATFTLAVLSAAAPQGGSPAAQSPLLTPAETKSLRDKLHVYLDAIRTYDEAVDKERDKASKAHEKAKEAFQKEWDARVEKKGDLMRSVPDLQALFDNCLKFKSFSGTLGAPRKLVQKGARAGKDMDYTLFVPKGYKPDGPSVRTVLVLPGLKAGTKPDDLVFENGEDWFAATWDKAASNADTIYHVCHIPNGMDLDALPKWGEPDADAKESERIGEALLSYRPTMLGLNTDRGRLFLDCGRGSSAFGLRLAAHFPNLFAGIIVRHPSDVSQLRLGNLTGLPILLLKSAETAAAADALKQRLDALDKNQCQVLEPGDAYPFKGATADIEKWMAGIRRDLFRTRIVAEPNDVRFGKVYWAVLGSMDPIHTLPPDRQPRLEVEADRVANRITVKARGIESFSLLLNDSLIDLDREFTVLVNDKAVTEKRTRQFANILKLLREKNDPNWLFPVSFNCMVPKVENNKPAEPDK